MRSTESVGARRAILVGLISMAGSAALAHPVAVPAQSGGADDALLNSTLVFNCMPRDPDAGDWLLEGGPMLLEVSAERTATPGYAGGETLVEGVWLQPWEAASLRGGAGENLANRVDIVFVGDGYTQANLPLYGGQVNAFAQAMFRDEPLTTYRPLFAVHRVDVVSNESGVSGDPTADVTRDTALGMRFWCGGTERALCVNVGAAWSYANTFPVPGGNGPDQVIALANSSKYGGVGYPGNDLGTAAAGNGAAVEIIIHELGHSFADLADEYTYGGPTVWNGGEPGTANVSTYTAATMQSNGQKWANWLGENRSGFDGLHSTFEGGNYSVQGIYRPTNNSKMRSLNRPFNLVNAESLIRAVYRTVRPIDSTSPAAGETVTEHTTLAVTPVRPDGHTLAVQWFLDGEPIPGATGETLDTCAAGAVGAGTISVQVRDNTDWVRNETFRNNRMTQTVDFPFELYAPGDFTRDGTVNIFDITFFLTVWQNGLDEADLDNDGANTVFDILRFLEAWNSTDC